jgi:hypothetical protein
MRLLRAARARSAALRHARAAAAWTVLRYGCCARPLRHARAAAARAMLRCGCSARPLWHARAAAARFMRLLCAAPVQDRTAARGVRIMRTVTLRDVRLQPAARAHCATPTARPYGCCARPAARADWCSGVTARHCVTARNVWLRGCRAVSAARPCGARPATGARPCSTPVRLSRAVLRCGPCCCGAQPLWHARAARPDRQRAGAGRHNDH